MCSYSKKGLKRERRNPPLKLVTRHGDEMDGPPNWSEKSGGEGDGFGSGEGDDGDGKDDGEDRGGKDKNLLHEISDASRYSKGITEALCH